MTQQATAPAELRETEITLGTGKLLGIFRALVIVCGIFFALGYNLGRASVPSPDPNAIAAAPTPAIASGGSKPSAVVTSAPAPTDSSTPATTASSAPGTPASQPAPQPPPADTKPSIAPTQPASPGSTFMVQVAAVTHKEDADALIAALRQKNYSPVIVSNLPDKLFHVQIGPFVDRKDATSMRERLLADGFNSILK